LPFNEIVARYLKAVGEPREVVRDPETASNLAPFSARSMTLDLNECLAA
jgi:hypothetical protein